MSQSLLSALIILCLTLNGCGQRAAEIDLGEAELWQPLEITLRANVQTAHPFMVEFQAKVTAPDGKQFTLPGFYDGQQCWKLRTMPYAVGQWSVVTESKEPLLHGQRYYFVSTPSKHVAQHGRLRVDEQHPHHFVFEDGTRFFMLAYECDWLWALDSADDKMKVTRGFLDRISGHGFNSVIVNSYAYDTKWRPGKTAADDYGPPAMQPWLGTAEDPDHNQLNLDYWQHYDRMMQALHERGMIPHVLCKVYNKKVKWPKRGSKADDLFFRTLIARYAAYPGVVWDFAKEAHNEKDMPYKLSRLGSLRESDPFHHLVTVHDDDKNYESGNFDPWVDFRTDQQHDLWREKILEQRGQHNWPVFNSEFGYEHGAGGPNDVTYPVAQSPEEFARRAWEISFAGGYTAYYHTHTAWDILRPEIEPPGYPLFGRIRQFFETTHYWELTPRMDASGGVWVLEKSDHEYVLWLPAGQTKAFTIPSAAGKMKAVWFQPSTGQREQAPEFSPGEHQLTAPATWSGGPAILHLTQATP